VAWYVYGLVGDLLARLALLVTGSTNAPGEMQPAAVLGYAVAAFAGGAIAANAVKPKADLKWGVVFALLVLASEVIGAADGLQDAEGRALAIFAAGGALIVLAAICGFFLVRSRTTPAPPPEPDLE
jgi:hypothetical protein